MAERRRSVTHDELKQQAEELVGHFDQRLKDSERVLTWRMVAVNSIAVATAGILGKVLTDPDAARMAVSIVRSLV